MSKPEEVYTRGLKKLKNSQKVMIHFDDCKPNNRIHGFDDFDKVFKEDKKVN